MVIEKIDLLKQHKKIFVLGFIGSEIRQFCDELATKLGYKLIDIDNEIEKKDGRTIKRLCMMMGEHEYRNKEYEVLAEIEKKELGESNQGIVVICSDGIVLDDMNLEILKRNYTIFLQEDLETLYENAICHKNNVPYAFISEHNQIFVKKHFQFLYESREKLYNQFVIVERTHK